MLKNIPALSEYDNGSGVCIFLKNDLCSIYQNRPDICNVEKMYLLYFKDYMTEEEYISKNMDACRRIKSFR
jgi:Fe-S-cluster containining protein